MTGTIHAQGNEFAVATGRGVFCLTGQSRPDDPPKGSRGLVITPLGDDDRACLLDPGDPCDLRLDGPENTLLRRARVIRNDYHGSGGALVFEGADAAGAPVHVIWTPGRDLESWYWANISGGKPPLFRTGGQERAAAPPAALMHGTRIATPRGEVPVQYLQPGLTIDTSDHGPQKVVWVGRRRIAGIARMAPVAFEIGAIGNHRRLLVSQRHRLLLAHPLAQLYFGQPEVLVPALALTNGRDIRIEPRERITCYHILMGSHQLLVTDGAAGESLYPGDLAPRAQTGRHTDPRPVHPLRDMAILYPELAGRVRDPLMRTARPVLPYREARFLAAMMGIADQPAKAPPRWLAAA